MKIEQRDFKENPLTSEEIKKLSEDGKVYSQKLMKDFVDFAKVNKNMPRKGGIKFK